MAVVNKLSVEKVLDKLRSNDAKNSSKTKQLDEKLKTLDEEMQRLRTQRNRLKRGPRTGTTSRD
jgi:chromosome segregation ATPase